MFSLLALLFIGPLFCYNWAHVTLQIRCDRSGLIYAIYSFFLFLFTELTSLLKSQVLLQIYLLLAVKVVRRGMDRSDVEMPK
jgi:hypothetical protein